MSASVPAPAPDSSTPLRLLFWFARHAPWVLRTMKPISVRAAAGVSRKVRRSTFANARRILGPHVSDGECAAFGRNVVGNFYEFVIDVARSSTMSPQQLRGKIEAVEGREAYLARRRAGGGAVVLTAHMGSFEVGLAALAEVEPHIHVVFKRDELAGFEMIRRRLRDNLGIQEAPIDEGWQTWIGLREALRSNHVVVMQGDRAMPGQKARAVPVLGGHLMLPLGPVRLAEISRSPIMPVFTVRTASGGCRLFAEPAIEVDPNAKSIDGVEPALLQVGKVIEKFVAAHPEQWLILDPAFVEDVAH